MSEKESHELFSLLNEEGKVLDNLRFFPGDQRSTGKELLDAAADMIRGELDGDHSSPFPDADLEAAYLVAN